MVFELLEILSKCASMLTYKKKYTSKMSLNVNKRLIKILISKILKLKSNKSNSNESSKC